MKRLLVVLTALSSFSAQAVDASFCEERGQFASMIAVARNKGLDERSVTDASTTDPAADLPTRMWRIETIQTIYRDFKAPVVPSETGDIAKLQCESALRKGKIR
jgi:hypothetical protein